jgi:alpha-N-acetylglucosamine transferase
MLTVACVYWEGMWKGKPTIYDQTWVEKLQRAVAKNLSIPHQFVCLSNMFSSRYDILPLENNWPGWWSKLELFKPGLFTDRVLYLDLDVLILKDLTSMAILPSHFMIAKGRATHGLHINRGQGLEVRRYQGSVMMFDPGQADDLYIQFDPKFDMKKYHSDQDYIGDLFPTLDLFPHQWIRKLEECPDGIPPKEAKIVLCIPDKNDVAAEKHKWVKDLWI